MPDNPKTVVVVDDDQSVRASLAWLLQSAGLGVTTFAGAREFLDGFDPAGAACLVLDIRLPEMSGLELQAEITARNWSVPIVVITGHGDVEIAVAAMKAGAVDFLQKPFSDEALVASIRSAIRLVETGFWPRRGTGAESARLKLLTARERQVLQLVIDGKQNKQIAATLTMSPRTVETHRRHIMRKTQAGSVAELVRLVLESRLPRADAQIPGTPATEAASEPDSGPVA